VEQAVRQEVIGTRHATVPREGAEPMELAASGATGPDSHSFALFCERESEAQGSYLNCSMWNRGCVSSDGSSDILSFRLCGISVLYGVFACRNS